MAWRRRQIQTDLSPPPGHRAECMIRLEVLAAKRDDTRGEVICFLQIFLLVSLDHQLVHHHNITIRQRLCRLKTKLHHRTSPLVNLDQPTRTGYTVDTTVYRWTRYLQVSELQQLLVLVLR